MSGSAGASVPLLAYSQHSVGATAAAHRRAEAERIGVSLQDFIRMLMATYFAQPLGEPPKRLREVLKLSDVDQNLLD